MGSRKATARRVSLPPHPSGDAANDQLWWGSHLVKTVSKRAVNQRLVLDALEGQGWPAGIDDPLPAKPGMVRRVRLGDTLRRLNRGQVHPLIRFRADGTGRGTAHGHS